jgi:hypothetical protein
MPLTGCKCTSSWQKPHGGGQDEWGTVVRRMRRREGGESASEAVCVNSTAHAQPIVLATSSDTSVKKTSAHTQGAACALVWVRHRLQAQGA